MFSILAMAPRGVSLAKKMFSGVVMRWMKYERGMMAMKPSEIVGVEEPDAQMVPAQRALRHAGPRAWPAPAPSPPATTAPTAAAPRPGGAASMMKPVRLMTKSSASTPAKRAGRIDARRTHHEAAPHGHAQPDHEEEPEQVEHGLVEEVERALEELEAEERQRDVVVDRRQHGAHEEGQETPEHDGVHHAGVRLRQRAHLAQRVAAPRPEPLRDPIEAVLGAPAARAATRCHRP